MNKDQVKGAAKDIVGKVQQEAGELTGDKEQQAKDLPSKLKAKYKKGLAMRKRQSSAPLISSNEISES